jgi:hypothetical protein
VDVDERGGAGPTTNLLQFATFGVNGIRGQNICPTTFAPHVWHLRGKFAPFTPSTKQAPCQQFTYTLTNTYTHLYSVERETHVTFL